MNWLEKIDFMIEAEKSRKYAGKYVVDVTFLDIAWEEGELEMILDSYQFLPVQYVEFIKKYNTIGIAWVVFYGSRKKESLSIASQIKFLTSEGLPKEYFPFGKYVDGSTFVFDKMGKVYLFDIDDYEFKEPENVAKSFDDFMENCLFKDRLGSSESTKSTSFYQFLQAQGWA